MENNNVENTMNNTPVTSGKKNGLMIVIIIVIILAIVAVVILKDNGLKKPNIEAPDQTTMDLNNALNTDSTSEINTNLDKINLDDTSTDDLKDVDSELEKL